MKMTKLDSTNVHALIRSSRRVHMAVCISQLTRNYPILHMAVAHIIAGCVLLAIISYFPDVTGKVSSIYVNYLSSLLSKFEFLDCDVSSIPLRHDEREVECHEKSD